MSLLKIVALATLVLILCSTTHAFAQEYSSYPTTNDTNISESKGAPTYNQIRINTANFILAQEMDHNATLLMEKSIEEQRNASHTFWKLNPLPTVNQTSDLVLQKLALAKSRELTNMDIEKRSWYDSQTQMDQNAIMAKLKQYLSEGRNSAPSFVDCQSWHSCNHVSAIPDTTIVHYGQIVNSTK